MFRLSVSSVFFAPVLAMLLALPASAAPEAAAPPPLAVMTTTATADTSRFPPELAKGRPRPADLNFFRVKDALTAYVNRLPDELKAGEKRRIAMLSTIRADLIKLMKFIPYDGTKTGVHLDNGKVIKGTVMGNEDELAVRPKRGKAKIVHWEDLPPSQYAAMLTYYGQYRLDHENSERPGAAGLRQRQKEAASDWFRAALLSDWYGNADEARRLARLALQLDPENLRPHLVALLPWTLADAPDEHTPSLSPAPTSR